MAKATDQPKDYQTARRELDEVLVALQSPDILVDEAVKLYERGLKLTAELRAHLEQAENKLERLKRK